MVEQRTEEWYMARAGKITASCFGDAMAFTGGEPGDVYKSGPRKGELKPKKPAAARGTLMRKLAFERMAGIPAHEVGGKALNWGAEVEASAVQTYELISGNIVVPSGFPLAGFGLGAQAVQFLALSLESGRFLFAGDRLGVLRAEKLHGFIPLGLGLPGELGEVVDGDVHGLNAGRRFGDLRRRLA